MNRKEPNLLTNIFLNTVKPRFVLDDVRETTLPEASFDIVVYPEAIEHIVWRPKELIIK